MSLFKKKTQTKAFSASETKKTLHQNLSFTAIEQYKLIRANLDFTLPEGEDCPVIGVTSAMRGEGKSTTAINLSYALAERGSKVLLIDGDLRLPSVAKKMDIPGTPGLTDLLMEKGAEQISAFRSSLLNSWYILPAGHIPPNPSELLSSARMQNTLNNLRKVFDYIIIDLPPVNLVSDAVAISSLITGMIVVVREGQTEKKELENCFRQLKLSNVKVLGCVMNCADQGGGSYRKYRKYKYYNHKYYKSYRNYRDYGSSGDESQETV